MARLHRIAVVVAALAVMPALAGCANFDPDNLDVFGLTEKKKIPGERKPVFPEGVPGVTQGVPPQYIKGNQAAAEAALAVPEAAPPPEEPKAEPPKPKPKRKAVVAKPRPAAAAPVQPVAQQPQQANPQQASPAPWPQASQPAPSGTAAWPAPPPSGTFSR